MNLWRLEWLRLTRTWRGPGLLVLYLFFGLLGPLTARYLSELLERFGTEGVEVTFPDPQPVDGLIQYLANAQQLGLVALVAAAAGALAIDSNPDVSTFLRTRLGSTARIILPRYVVYTTAGAALFAAGTLAAWYETSVLIGALPAGAVLLGILFGAGYYAYLVALVALAGSLARGALGATLIALGLALAEPVIGLIDPVSDWLPSSMAAAIVTLTNDETTALELLRPLLVASALVALALLAAIRLSERREI